MTSIFQCADSNDLDADEISIQVLNGSSEPSFCIDLVTIITDDDLEEDTEVFTLEVSKVNPSTFNPVGSVTVNIQDNDEPEVECTDLYAYYYYYYHYYFHGYKKPKHRYGHYHKH